MTRRDFIINAALLGLAPSLVSALSACRKENYSASDFEQAPKTDAHFHYNTFDDAYLTYANSLGMHILSINVNAEESIDRQLDIVTGLRKQHPGMIDFLGTFLVNDFGKDDFVDRIIARINLCMDLGARGIKIWKNIGMDLQDEHGNYVMADNPAFAPVFAYLEKQGIPLTAHLGEPKNCWLPIEEMTVKGNQAYYRQNPQYHMYQHPEMPSYEQQIAARDHLLERYPNLSFVGAHLGSLEWSIDEIAKRFDAHPRFAVDTAARVQFLQLQALQDRDKMVSFLTKYQDRILYGTDITLTEKDPAKREEQKKKLHDKWVQDWNFFATDEFVPTTQFVDESLPKEMKGLSLPRDIVDKIFYGNTKRIFG